MKGESFDPADIAASFQKAVVEVLVENSMKAAEDLGMYKFAIAGGVASNTALRAAMKQACAEREIRFYHPSPIYCTDNAAMIGAAAFMSSLQGPGMAGSERRTQPETGRKVRREQHMEKEYCTAIVLAAGSGRRMGTKVHKQYLLMEESRYCTIR